MRAMKRFLALLLVFIMVQGMIPGLWQTVHAAGTLNISLDGTGAYANGKLNIKWDLIPMRGLTVVTYHIPEDPTNAKTIMIQASDTTVSPNKATISGLKNDYIYDITVDVYSTTTTDQTAKLATGTMHFLPQISFYSSYVDQQCVDDPAGGRESGVIPTLKISWVRPKVYDGMGHFIDVGDSTAFSKIDPSVAAFNYGITIKDQIQRSDVLINYDPTNLVYKASVTGSSRTSVVNYDSVSGTYYFYLLGKKDDNSTLPTDTDLASATPSSTTNLDTAANATYPAAIYAKSHTEYKYILPDDDIRPGTVYYMQINSFCYDNYSNYLSSVTPGPAGNPLVGLPYTYTPVHFQLTKNSLDNVNVKIYTINKGSLSMPNIYYSVQLNSQPTNDDWASSPYKDKFKKLDGSYFTGEYAYTVVTGLGINNKIFYRVIVGTNSTSDQIKSLTPDYTISTDTSRPPVPQNVQAKATQLNAGNVTIPGVPAQVLVKSSDVVISWDKPANYDQLKMLPTAYDATKDVYYHLLINTAQNESDSTPYPSLIADGQKFGEFPLNYRLVKYISINDPNIRVNGNRLEYTISAFDLFEGEHLTIDNSSGTPVYSVVPESINNTRKHPGENYPTYFLPNTAYYVRMYTTSEANRGTEDFTDPTALNMSDKSLTTSFTTLSASQQDVPLVNHLQAKTGIDTSGATKTNYIQLQFDKIKINWNNYIANHDPADALYYDIYMSTRMDGGFIKVGSTEDTTKDVVFDKLNDSQSVFATAKISKFAVSNNVTYFGNSLKPNTTYYFYVKTRLVMVNSGTPKESLPTAILPVSTLRTDVITGDDSTKRPIAPIDFTVAKDASGNPMITGKTVAFNWAKKEAGVTYQIICTTAKMAPDGDLPIAGADPIYDAYKTNIPSLDISSPATGFTYDRPSNLYTYSGVDWLFPNRLYYFSIRAVKSATSTSVWVSIPVTTSLIEGPANLEPVNDSELALSWRVSGIDLNEKLEDYKISVKGPKDTAYVALTRSQATLVRDANSVQSDYYLRIFHLKANTSYDVKVEKPTYNNGQVSGYTTAASKTGMKTKDDDHQIEVKWQGLPPADDPSPDQTPNYEIAIKRIDDPDYTILKPSDLELYTELGGARNFPYYMEKTALTIGTKNLIFHAKIKSVEVTLADGTKEHQQLKANTKYYIKVRAIKKDTVYGIANVYAYSKYIGPVDTRTEFNQGDYDQNDDDTKNTASFLDRISKLEQNLFWRVNMGSSAIDKILLKGDRVKNALENNGAYPLTVDLSSLGTNLSTDSVYIPGQVAQEMNDEGKSLIIKTYGGEYTFRPQTMDMSSLSEVSTMKSKTGISDVYLKLTVTRTDLPKAIMPAQTKSASKLNDVDVQVVGSTKTDADLTKMIHDKLYDNSTGLIKQKTDMLSSREQTSTSQTAQQLSAFIDSIVSEVESELSDYLQDTMDGVGSTAGLMSYGDSVKTFSGPLSAKLTYNTDQGVKVPYISYDTTGTWQKLSKNILNAGGALTFNVTGSGKYCVLSMISASDSVPADYWAKDSITKLTGKYDLSGVFAGINSSFSPDTAVTGKDMVLLYEKILDKTDQNSGMDVKQKMKTLGLDTILSSTAIYQDLKKQQSAAILLKLYSVKLGLNADSLKPKQNTFINDESSIDAKYYNASVLSINMGFLSLDNNNNFLPGDTISRAEICDALVKVLTQTGDLN